MSNAGNTLTDLIRNFGWAEFTVEPIRDDYVPIDGHNLGNGNYVYGSVSDSHDGSVYGTEGEPIDLSGTSYSEFTNLSSRFTGQHGRPNGMHDSEYVGGGMADVLAETPGEYCLPYIVWPCTESCSDCDGSGVGAKGVYCDQDLEGWLCLYRSIDGEAD